MKTISLVMATALIFLMQFTLRLPVQPWPYLCAIFLISLQPRFGWRLKESLPEFVGFVAANVIALSIGLFLPPHTPVQLLATLGVVLSMLFAMRLRNRLRESSLIAAVSLVILLFQPQPSFNEIILRLMEINIGILTAIVVTRFIVTQQPLPALINEYRYTLKNCRQLFLMAMQQPRSIVFDQEFPVLENNLRASLHEQRALIAETSPSLSTVISKEKLVMNISKQQSLIRNTMLLAQLMDQPEHEFFSENYGDYLEKLRNAIFTAFEQLISMLEKNAKPATYFDLYEVFASVEENLRHYRDDSAVQNDRVQAFIFTLQQLVKDIDEWCGSCLEVVNRHED